MDIFLFVALSKGGGYTEIRRELTSSRGSKAITRLSRRRHQLFFWRHHDSEWKAANGSKQHVCFPPWFAAITQKSKLPLSAQLSGKEVRRFSSSNMTGCFDLFRVFFDQYRTCRAKQSIRQINSLNYYFFVEQHCGYIGMG